MGHADADFCLFGVCGPFREFWKVHSVSRGTPLVWKAAQSGSDWTLEWGGAGSQGITGAG